MLYCYSLLSDLESRKSFYIRFTAGLFCGFCNDLCYCFAIVFYEWLFEQAVFLVELGNLALNDLLDDIVRFVLQLRAGDLPFLLQDVGWDIVAAEILPAYREASR